MTAVKYLAPLLICLVPSLVVAQQLPVGQANKTDSIIRNQNKKVDSVQRTVTHQADSVVRFGNKKVDSVQRSFRHRTDSLQRAYAAPLRKMDSDLRKLNHKKDSLSRLRLPTTSVTHRIDSISRAKTAALRDLNTKIEKAKKETLAGINSLHLPPQAQSEVNALTKNINGFTLPRNFLSLPGMNLAVPGLSSKTPLLSLPTNFSIPTAGIPSLQKVSLSAGLPPLASMQGTLSSQLRQAQTATNLQAAEKTITNALAKDPQAKAILKEEAQATALTKKVSQLNNPKRADSLAMAQLKPQINHFAGKEKELQAAMNQVSKYKQKYTNVSSLASLPKRPPNPLRGKPWQERLVPGVNYFVLARPYTLVDVNPYIGWRISPHFTTYLGWNERIGIHHGTLHTDLNNRVYGVRALVSYHWVHGFIFRLSPEAMEAYIPAGNADVRRQALVWGWFTGIRKDFKIYKNITGYSEGMYNLNQKPGQNIYGDRLSLRMGIEVKLKKKVKK